MCPKDRVFTSFNRSVISRMTLKKGNKIITWNITRYILHSPNCWICLNNVAIAPRLNSLVSLVFSVGILDGFESIHERCTCLFFKGYYQALLEETLMHVRRNLISRLCRLSQDKSIRSACHCYRNLHGIADQKNKNKQRFRPCHRSKCCNSWCAGGTVVSCFSPNFVDRYMPHEAKEGSVKLRRGFGDIPSEFR